MLVLMAQFLLTGLNSNKEAMMMRRKRIYIPDFYLPDHDTYIEVKGYWTDAARYKMKNVMEVNEVKIVILESLEAVNKFTRWNLK